MLVTTAVSLFFGVWSSIFLVDHYLRALNLRCYIQFVKRIGLTVSFLQLRFYTYRQDEKGLGESVSMSGWIDRLRGSRVVSVWLVIGSAMALLSLCGMTLYLTKLLLDEVQSLILPLTLPSALFQSSHPLPTTPLHPSPSNPNSGLTPVVPGVNMPWWHVPLFVSVCILAGVVHELGHALAALHSRVPVSGFGIFLLAIYPGAFTEIDTDALKRSTPAQRMRIFGAGIWCNLVLALIGYLVFISTPLLLSPLYSRDSGVLITRVSAESGLSGAAGLGRGDVVHSINSCPTPSLGAWFTCVDHLRSRPLPGYCLPSIYVMPRIATQVNWVASGELQCCGSNSSEISQSHMCFQFLPSPLPHAPRLAESLGLQQPHSHVIDERSEVQKNGEGGVNVQANARSEGTESGSQHSCLMARFVTDHEECEDSSDCEHLSTKESASVCVHPALFNGTSLLRLFTRHSSKPVLFVGHIDELVYYVELSELVPRFAFVPLWIPSLLELFAKYLVTFSLAMALLNAVPCYGLDGHFMSSTIVDTLFSHYSPSRRRRLNSSVLCYGTFVLSSNLIVAFLRFFLHHFKFLL